MPNSIHTPAYQSFCRLLVKAREDKSLTQEELACRLGQPQSFVSKVENGERRVDVVEFLEIARVLDLNPAAFINKVQEAVKDTSDDYSN